MAFWFLSCTVLAAFAKPPVQCSSILELISRLRWDNLYSWNQRRNSRPDPQALNATCWDLHLCHPSGFLKERGTVTQGLLHPMGRCPLWSTVCLYQAWGHPGSRVTTALSEKFSCRKLGTVAEAVKWENSQGLKLSLHLVLAKLGPY